MEPQISVTRNMTYLNDAKKVLNVLEARLRGFPPAALTPGFSLDLVTNLVLLECLSLACQRAKTKGGMKLIHPSLVHFIYSSLRESVRLNVGLDCKLYRTNSNLLAYLSGLPEFCVPSLDTNVDPGVARRRPDDVGGDRS